MALRVGYMLIFHCVSFYEQSVEKNVSLWKNPFLVITAGKCYDNLINFDCPPERGERKLLRYRSRKNWSRQ